MNNYTLLITKGLADFEEKIYQQGQKKVKKKKQIMKILEIKFYF